MKTLGADDVDLQPGAKVGEYVVDGKIGEGGFGTVFKATHPLIGKQVAIKVLNRQFSAQAEMVSRFISEARAVNQIRHRNIIDIFAFGQLEDGRHYYLMEFLDGMPLDEYLDQRGRVALGEAIPILRAIARALDAAHGKGIAHRDLKPENVFLVRDDDGGFYPKLLDFGIAKLLTADGRTSHKTRTGAPIGTPYYMSPEQARGREVDHRTDIYAFGVMAYRMLAGVLPFDGEDYMDILLAQIGKEAAPPTSIAPDLPKSVDDGIGWMLRKDPAERPPNLVTAVRALEDAASAAGITIPTGPGPSGVYAASTGAMLSQRTPSTVTPMPRTGDLGMADTIGADAHTSEQLAAAVAKGEGRKRKAPLLIGALAGAVVVGAVVFFVVKGLKKDDGGDQPKVTEPAPTAAPTPEPVKEPARPPQPPTNTLPPPVQEPEVVNIKVLGAPEGAEVYSGGKLVGVVPDVQLPRGDIPLLLTFQLDGWKPATQKVTPTGDQQIKVAMKEKRGGRPGGGHPRPPGGGDKPPGGGTDNGGHNTLEDPFKKNP
ncbi:MAG TPA: protein kinase [Kofleriaceae bacterium]|nr:protein kinase [Kofleriaceae bacterium]